MSEGLSYTEQPVVKDENATLDTNNDERVEYLSSIDSLTRSSVSELEHTEGSRYIHYLEKFDNVIRVLVDYGFDVFACTPMCFKQVCRGGRDKYHLRQVSTAGRFFTKDECRSRDTYSSA